VRTRFAGWSDEEVQSALEGLASKRDRVLDGARIEPGDTVADVGAGTGLLALGAVERVGPDGDVLAIDLSVDALTELRSNTTAPNVSYLVGTAEVLPLPDESVDAVVMRSVLIYVNEKEEAAKEFHRVLRPGARASLFEPINSANLRLSEAVDFSTLGELGERVRAWNEAFYSNPDDPMINFDETDLERFFDAAGFADVRLEHGIDEHRVAGARCLSQVGAPGRPTLLERWQLDFPVEDVERLEAFLRDRLVPLLHPYVFLTATKP
jgi:arsenite methyltransferase